MENEKLVIPRKKYREESTVISMRIPKDMLRKLDRIAETTGRTRNEVLMLSLEFALDHMDAPEE